MEIIPAIDILDGRVVQLVGGKPGTRTYYGNPTDTAKKWVKKGARILHVIDLDAALGSGDNMESVMSIREGTKVEMQFGGGIRTIEKAEMLLDAGIERVILGTIAIKSPGLLKELDSDRIVVALDSKNGKVVIEGWRKKTSYDVGELINKFEDFVWGFLYTNVDVEGRMMGVDIEKIRDVVEATEKPLMISGGISSVKDVRDIEKTGAWGVVLGRALYEGKIRLEDLL